MSESSTVRRIAVRGLAVLAGVAAVTSLAMPSAFADNAYYSTLDVTAPTAGSIDSVDGNFNQIHCGPDAPGPCTITDQQSELGGRPTTGWYTYDLQASGGPAGYSWRWTSGCTGVLPTCTIVNDQEFTSVGGEWVDTERPVITAVHVPTWTDGAADVSVDATDNSGTVAQYLWTVCPQFAPECTVFDTTTVPQWKVPALPDGAYLIDVQVLDAAGNPSQLGWDWLNVDTVAPKVTVLTPRQNASLDTFVATLDFRVNETSIAVSQCRVDATDWQPCGPGWATPQLDNGAHTLAVQVIDNAGNLSTVKRKITVVEPQVSLVGAAESVYGRRASITVQAPANSNGLVEFDDASTGQPLCIKPAGLDGAVTCAFDGMHFRPGVHDVFVRYTGDATHNMAAATFQYTVLRKPVAIAAQAQQGRYGTEYPVTISGLPNDATGAVVFRVGDTTLCTARVRQGEATCAAGARKLEPSETDYRVTAAYSGDEIYGDASRTFKLHVRKGIVELTATNSDLVPAIAAGSSVTLTARGLPGNATGSVVFTAGERTLCTAQVARGVASCDTGTGLPVGTYDVLASYTGDVHYAKATATTSFEVTAS